ncbi:hypothetical protein [Streptomyces sp. NPDC051662]|uniref:hypothetical protein n=1 Tax=Streptomyces sp. NPDC051662 TaxID=3154750 RepID=UPI003449017A
MVATVCSCGADAEMPLNGSRPPCTHDGEIRTNGGIVLGGYVVRPATPGTCHTDRHTVHNVARWEARNTVARCGECVAADLGVTVDALPGQTPHESEAASLPDRTSGTNLTSYTDFHGTRIGITPVESGGEMYVSVTTKEHNHGLFRLSRCGESPLTPAGRLTANAVRTLKAYLRDEKGAEAVPAPVTDTPRMAATDAPTAPAPHGYTWADAREIKARDLTAGDVFVKPGTGTAYTTATDGTVRGAGIAFGMELDGTAWTVVSRTADTATCTSHTGQTLTDAPLPDTSRVLRVREEREETMDAAEAVARVKEIYAASQDEAPAPAAAVLARIMDVISQVDATMVMYDDRATDAIGSAVDDTTPLDEMGTDDLLTVLRENTVDIPKWSLFAEAWALLDRILTDGGPECLPAPWDGPAEGTLIPHDADPETLINLNARFTPQAPVDPEGDTHPCTQVGTAQIYTYRKNGRLVVAVETSGMDSTGDSVETDADGNVPMTITVNGHVVFTE